MQKYLGLLSVFGMLMWTCPLSAGDVYVDLSVLENLDNNAEELLLEPSFPSYGIPVHPMAESVSKPVPAKAASKPASTKNTSKPVEAIKVPSKPVVFEKKHPVLPAAPVKPVIKQTVPAVVKIKATKPVEAQSAAKIVHPENKTRPVEKIKRDLPARTEKIKVETKSETQAVKSEAVKDVSPMTPISANLRKENVVEPISSKISSEEKAPDVKPEEIKTQETKQVEENILSKAEVAPVAKEAEKTVLPVVDTIEPLIPENISEEASVLDGTIRFTVDSYELGAENEMRLTKMAERFSSKSNKILIAAYNFNSGDVSFKTKRLNLNRAVEIRSFLMGLGYKNFSIKIINTDNRDKENLAEVSELVY